jgi:hypothetical protein
MATPASLRPQVVAGCARRVIIGFAQRDAQDREAHGQTQAHDLATPPPRASTAEGACVVTLGHGGHAHLVPGVQEVVTRRRCRLRRMGGRGGIVTVAVDGGERLPHFAPGHPTGDEVGGMDGIGRGRLGMRPIGMAALLWCVERALVALEDALHRAQTRRWLRVAARSLLLQRAGSHRGKAPAWLAMPPQELAQAYDAPPAPGGELLGRMGRRTGSRAEAGPRLMGAIVHPCVDPATATVESVCHCGGRGAGTVAFHRYAATLGILVIRSSGAGQSSPPQLR